MRTLSDLRCGARRGMTIVELAIVVAIAALLFGSVAVTVMRADRMFVVTQNGSDAERVCDSAIERIAREFMDADRNSLALTPAAPLQATSVSFRRVEGWSAGAMTLGPLRRVRFELEPAELADGLDNDGDGAVDEGRVVLDLDVAGGGTSVVLVSGVRALSAGELANGVDDNGDGRIDEPGFFAEFDAATSTLFLRLTVERRTPQGGVAARSAELSVRVRNG